MDKKNYEEVVIIDQNRDQNCSKDEMMRGGTVCDTHVNLALESTYQCTWELRNFTERYKNVNDVVSGVFVAGDVKFVILLSMDMDLHKHEAHVKAVQKKCNESVSNHNFHINIYLLKKNNEETQKNIYFFTNFEGKQCKICLLVHKTFILSEANNLLTDNSLKILCKIVKKPSLVEKKQKSGNLHLSPIHQLNQDFVKFLDNEKFSDVRFIINDQNIYAHKIILTNISPVFAAMFSSDMVENKDNVVKVEEMRYEVFREMLEYIYTGKSLKINEMTEELSVAADRYEITGLLQMCSEILYNSLTMHNALDLLQLADRLNIQKVKNKALDIIKSNARYMGNKPEFKDIPKDLIVEVFQEVTNGKKRKSDFS